MLTILEGSTFCICDDRGDIAAETSGFFAHDTRFLSRLVLRVGGTAPLLLSSGRVEHFQAAFYLRNGTANGLPRDSISIARERFVGTRHAGAGHAPQREPERLEVEVALEAEADFADIISVKLHDFSLGDPELAQPLPPPAPTTYDEGRSQISIVDPRGDLGTQLAFTKPGRLDGNAMTFSLTLESHESWDVSVDVRPWLEEDLETFEQLDDERETVGDVVAAWTLRVPRVRGGWESLRRAFDRSIADLAALRMRTGETRRPLFAAGMPWFMTVFGRDTAITSLQTLLLGPEIAVGALDALTELQAQVGGPDDRRRAGQDRPRGAGGPLRGDLVPALLRLDRLDAALSRASRRDLALDGRRVVRAEDARAGASSPSSGSTATAIATGTASSSTAAGSTAGLANQSWKDSGDSQRFQDGSFAEAPIAAVEVQGYVYDAKRGLAEIAREVWREQELADRLDREADELRKRFDEAFWVEERGGFYALALDGQKRASTPLVEHGPPPLERDRASREGRQVVDQLLSEELWTGWGIRTMASDAAAFNPISYHNGTVWPHDTSLAAWGSRATATSPRRDVSGER